MRLCNTFEQSSYFYSIQLEVVCNTLTNIALIAPYNLHALHMLVNRSNSGTYCTLLHTILDSECHGLGLHVTVTRLARATEPPEPPIVRLPAEDSLYGNARALRKKRPMLY